MEFKYKGLEGTLERLEVTEEELDRQLQRLEGQDTSEFTPEELRSSVAQTLRNYYDQQAEEELCDRLIRQAADTLDYVPEEDAIVQNVQGLVEALEAQLGEKGLTMAAYYDFMNITEERLREDLRPDAVQLLKIQKAIDLIVELEGITVTEEELALARAQVLQAYQMDENSISPEDAAALAGAVKTGQLQRKALELVRSYAVVTEVTVQE